MQKVRSFWLALAGLVLFGAGSSGQESRPTLLTVAEASGFTATGTTGQVRAFLVELARLAPGRLRLLSLGTSPAGQEIPLVVLGRPLPERPIPRKDRQRPVLYLQANIHAGEVEGKEALQILLRRLLLEDDLPGLLDHVVLIVAPVFNCDGNDQISTTNRPHQNGPAKGVGVRHNGQGLDLNRDAIKLDSLEMRGLLERVILPWDPDLLVDCHATNGSRNEHALQAESSLLAAMDPELRAFGRDLFLPALFARVREETDMEFIPYGHFRERSDPVQGWVTFAPLPRMLVNYMGARGRLALLSEAYVYADFRTRVEATLAFVRAALAEAGARRGELLALARDADARATGLAARSARFGLGHGPATARPTPIRVIGQAEKQVEEGPASRPRWVPAGPVRPWEVPFLGDYPPLEEVRFAHGWLLPPEALEPARLLARHGLVVQTLQEERLVAIERFQILSLERAARPYQGRRLLTLQGRMEPARVRLPAGTLFVSSASPLAWLAAWLLEPGSSDGLTAWGDFDPWLQQGSFHPVLRLLEPLSPR